MKRRLDAMTVKRACGCGKIYTTLDYNEELNPIRLHITLGKAGGCAASQLNAIESLINLRIEEGGDLSKIYDKSLETSLINIRCPERQANTEEEKEPAPEEKYNFSCADTIAKSIRYLIGELDEKKEEEKKKKK